MKIHPEANELAARLAAAANQPPAVLETPVVKPPTPEPRPEGMSRKPSRTKPKQTRSKDADENTVPISLRPGRSLWNRYIIAAAERTREAGRVISAQQIMLEVLERGI